MIIFVQNYIDIYRIWAVRGKKPGSTRRKKAGDLYIPRIHALLFAWQDRKVQSEEENQQEEAREEEQRNKCHDKGYEVSAHQSNCEEAE